jgi:hypothetical protein
MADTYITDRDRYSLPTVSSGQFTEDINTRASANLGTMSGQLNLLQMQKLQSEVDSADMLRRQTVFQEDQRFKKQAEADDYAGFLGTQADQPDDVRSKNNNQYLKENPNLLQNAGAMEMFKNVDIGSRAQSEYNKRRVEDKQTAYSENKVDFDIENQDKAEETALLQMDNTLKAATAQRDAFDTALNSGKLNDVGEVSRLLNSSSLDVVTKNNFSDVMSDLRLMGNETYNPALLNMASALSAGSNLDKTYDYKMARNIPLLNSLAKSGISVNWKGTDEEFEASIDEAEKNIMLNFPDPADAQSRMNGLNKAAKDITEYRTAGKINSENMARANEKLVALKELTKKANLGDPEAKIEAERMFSELSVIAGSMKGIYDKNMSDVERIMKLDKDNLDVRTKETNISKKLADIANSRDAADRDARKLELDEITNDDRSRAAGLDLIQKALETAKGPSKIALEEELQRMNSRIASGVAASGNGSTGSMIPR